MATVLITGGTGLVGTALSRELLNKGYDLIILSRSPQKRVSTSSRLTYAHWDVGNKTIDRDAITRADYIVHLAGENLAKRWTSQRKKEIVESRIRSSELLVKALTENSNRVKAVVSASGIGWYGNGPNSESGADESGFSEADPAADDFLGTTCQQWEASIDPVANLGKRLVKLRSGIVLSNDGGALPEFKKPLRFGLATILGNGKQVMSWIHIDDMVRLYGYAIENEKLHGVYNGVAPHPVTNKKFVLQLARSFRGKYFIPAFIPSFVLKAVFGEKTIEVLKSTSVSCKKIRAAGFTFLYPSITAALHHLSE
jgi:uncharacterized protein (TIGR01777 family)